MKTGRGHGRVPFRTFRDMSGATIVRHSAGSIPYACPGPRTPDPGPRTPDPLRGRLLRVNQALRRDVTTLHDLQHAPHPRLLMSRDVAIEVVRALGRVDRHVRA